MAQHWVDMTLLGIIRRDRDKHVALYPWINPWNWIWNDTADWDMDNANWADLDEREPDIDLIWRTIELVDAGNYSEAVPIWTSLANRGSVRSMVELGGCHEYGRGVPVDLGLAETWYKQALVGGSQYAMLKCAQFAASRQDFTECDAILQPGVEERWAAAAFWQAWYRWNQGNSEGVYRSIFPLLKLAGKQGHPAGKLYLSNFMVRGKFGVFRVPIGFFLAVGFVITELRRHRPAEEFPAAS